MMRTIRRRKAISEAEGARMVKLYYDGLTFSSIAARLDGRGKDTVRKYLIRIGIHQPESQSDVRRRIDGAVHWYERGVTVEQIVWQFKISAPTLYSNIRRRGIPLRRPAVSEGMRRAYANGAEP